MRCTGLDVRRSEPPTDSRFFELDNVVSTPHCASRTDGTFQTCGDMIVRNIRKLIRSERPEDMVNAEA